MDRIEPFERTRVSTCSSKFGELGAAGKPGVFPIGEDTAGFGPLCLDDGLAGPCNSHRADVEGGDSAAADLAR